MLREQYVVVTHTYTHMRVVSLPLQTCGHACKEECVQMTRRSEAVYR